MTMREKFLQRGTVATIIVRIVWFLLLSSVCGPLAAAPNKPPAVTLTSPTNGAAFEAPATISLAASASDPNGTVVRVDFWLYSIGTLIGTSTTPPFTATWADVPAGSYSLFAIATDNAGATANSALVSITVTSPTGLVITNPIQGAAINIDGGVTVSGTYEGATNSTIIVDDGNTSAIATISGNTFTANLPFAIGASTLTARLSRTDKTSAMRSVSVTGYAPPVVAFLEPSCNTFDSPASIPLTVDAKAPGGNISKVDFYQGSTLLGTVSTPPYTFIWANVPQGTHTVTARAENNYAIVGTATTTVTVNGPNTLPSISIASPAPGANFTAPANIPISVAAGDLDGSVAMVEYFSNEQLFHTTNVEPFAFTWTGVPMGSYSLTARATDNRGGQTTSVPVNITVASPNLPPTVTFTTPANGAVFTAPATVNLAASASDPDGTIAKVEFFNGASLIATVMASPYEYAWTNVSQGTYSLTAKATDDRGGTTTSDPVSITVNPPLLTFASPAEGATVDDNRVLVTGQFIAPPLSGVTVNGVVAILDTTGNFYANNVPLAAGTNTVTATLTRPDGTTATRTLTLNSSGPAPIRIDLDPLEGAAPLTVTFNIVTTGGANFARADYDFDGNGTIDDTQNPPGGTITLPYSPAGVYTPIVTATDSFGRTVQRRFAVNAEANPDDRLRATFNAMTGRLRAGDVDGAMNFITGGGADQYRNLFNTLRDAGRLPQAVDALGTLQGSTVGPNFGELILRRESLNGPTAFPIWFLRGADGVWRIEGM